MKGSSPDTAKENASVVGSSLTGCKQEGENSSNPGSSGYRENEEMSPVRKEENNHPCDRFGNLRALRNDKLDARYFIIKSLNHHNIHLSIEKGIWATQVMNEPILEEAFNNTNKVILIFSVNMSGFFQGYAQMMSSVGWRQDDVWSESTSRSNPWGRTFKVKWLQLHNLPFQETLHLKNPLNDYKPVKISRDCQELSPDVGEALCQLIDRKIGLDGRVKRNNIFKDEFLVKRPRRESSVPLRDEDFVLSGSSPHVSWAPAPVYPSLLSQNSVLDFHRTQSTNGRPCEELVSEYFPSYSVALQGPWGKYSGICGNSVARQAKKDISLGINDNALSNGRNPSADSIADEDILDMTYEEYLRVHGKSSETSNNMAAKVGTSWKIQGPAVTIKQDDDGYSRYLAEWYRSHNKNTNAKCHRYHHTNIHSSPW